MKDIEPSNAVTLRTNTALLNGLRGTQDEVTWRTFVQRYEPVLLAFGKKLGLSDATAADAAQEALIAFLEAYRAGKYDRDKGRLRSWLLGIAINCIRRQHRNAGRERAVAQNDGSTAFLQKVPDAHTWSDVWEAQWRQAILQACMDELRKVTEPRTMQAFELYVLQEWPADKVAEAVGVSRDAVFQTKRRLLKKMRETLATLEESW